MTLGSLKKQGPWLKNRHRHLVGAFRLLFDEHPCVAHFLDYPRHYFLRRAELLRAILAEAPLDLSVGEALRPYADAEREADQVRVLELHARTFVAIVEDGVDSGDAQLAVDAVGG